MRNTEKSVKLWAGDFMLIALLYLAEVGKVIFLKKCLFLREGEKERGRVRAGRGKERGKQNLKQAPGSELSHHHRARRGAQTDEPRDRDPSPSWPLKWTEPLRRL